MSARPARRRQRAVASSRSARQHRRARFAGYARRLRLESLEDRRLLAVVTVNTDNDVLDGDTTSIANLIASPGPDGALSLREAITAANNTPNVGGPDEIGFNIGGGESPTIQLLSALPTISDPVILDGSTQPGYLGSPIVELNGLTGGTVLTLTADDSIIRGLAARTSGTAVYLSGADRAVISNLDLSWMGAGKLGRGIELYNSSYNTLENVTATNRERGILVDFLNSGGISSGNVYRGNTLTGAAVEGIAAWHGQGQGNKYLNNDLSNSGYFALAIGRDNSFEIAGNIFSGSAHGLKLGYLSGATVTPDVVDLRGIQGTALCLETVTNSHVSDLDLSWAGSNQSGNGIELYNSSYNTIENVTATNRERGILVDFLNSGGVSSGNVYRGNTLSGAAVEGIAAWHGQGQGNKYLNNDLSNSGYFALGIGRDNSFEIGGNIFFGSAHGLKLGYLTGATVTPDIVDLRGIQGTALCLETVTNSHVSDLDLSWAGSNQSGNGIELYNSSYNTIENVTATNRERGILVDFLNSGGVSSGNVYRGNTLSGAAVEGIAAWHGQGQGNKYLNNDLSNSGYFALGIGRDNSFEIGGNIFFGSAHGLKLGYLTGATVTPDVVNLRGIQGTALSFDTVSDARVSALDLSWTGTSKSGIGIELVASSNNTLDHITVSNRAAGIYLNSSSNTTIHLSSILGNSTGVSVAGASTGTVLNYNEIAGNSQYGVSNASASNPPTDVVNAEYNYWGAADGPQPVGSGDAITARVDAIPFLGGASLTVTNTNDSGAGSLRHAIQTANVQPGLDLIDFDIPGTGPYTITLASALPAITDSVVLDGATQPGYAGTPIVEIDVGTTSPALTIVSDSNTVQGFAIRTAGTAIRLSGAEGNTLANLDLSFTAGGASGVGVQLADSSGNTIERVRAENRQYGIQLNYTNYSGYGGHADNSSDNVIRDNDLSEAGLDGIDAWESGGVRNSYLNNDVSNAGDFAIRVGRDSDFVIGGNDFRGSSHGLALRLMTGIELNRSLVDLGGVAGNLLLLSEVSNSWIHDLDLSFTAGGTSGIGIQLLSSSNNTLDQITAANRATGIYFSSSSNTAVQCSSILNNSTGVGVVGSSSGIVLNYNHIAGNSSQGVSNSAAALVNAESNYWGSASGPRNLGGAGDSYSGNVDADPWLSKLPLCVNSEPNADAGGPYAVVTGRTVTLDATGSSDADQPPETLTYEWDLDGDGVFGETGLDAAQGEETGTTPSFSSAGLPAPGVVTVTLRVTDGGGLASEDTALIEIYGADLTIPAGGIVFAPINPEPGQSVLIMASVVNQGVVDSPAAVVKFFSFDELIGTATVASLTPGQSADVSIQPTFASAGLRLITVKVDPDNALRELDEENNEASAVLQVGEPTGSDEAAIVVAVPGHTAYQGRPVTIGGRADYDFLMTPQSPDYPVQGAQVTVTVIDPATSQVLGVYTGAKTDASGNFWQGVWAPVDVGTYTLRVKVTDNTTTGQFDTTLNVIVEPSLPPVPPPSPPSGTACDVSVYSENIFFSEENPDLGEPITIYAFVGYVGQTPAEDVTITLNDLFPVGGTLHTFPIGSTRLDFPASPTGTIVAVSLPWTNTADGAHVIQVATQPAFAQFTGNDRATRLIEVGSPLDTLTMTKTVVLAVDADGNGIATPGDTLQYTISFSNSGTDELTGAVILDDFDETLLQTPFAISDDGTVVEGTILWDLATIGAEASRSVTYLVAINPAAEFPGGITTVVNTALLDTDQTAPIAATAQIEVTGDVVPPTIAAIIAPEANEYGWNQADVELVLTATDNGGGSGVREIVYSVDGGPTVTVPGDTVTLNFADEGVYHVAYHAVDVALNVEDTQTIEIKIDKTPPVPAHSGPFFVDEGDSIELVGSGSTDALSGVAGVAWSLDGDGLFDDGDPAVFLALDGPSTREVFLQVTDKAGNVAVVQSQVSVRNVPPTANPDGYCVDEDGTLFVSAEAGVLSNDTDPGPDRDDFRAELSEGGGPAHGSLSLQADGSFEYIPDDDYNGLDGFVYRVFDGDDYSEFASVSILVTSVNDPPVAGDDAFQVDEDHVLAGSSVLANDDDLHGGAPSEDNVPLTARLVSDVSHGTLILQADGTFTYTPAPNLNGTDGFSYEAVDSLGGVSDTATVTIVVRSVIDAAIDIKPGSSPNSINLGSKGVLAVALLSTRRADGELEDFDATAIDPATILFGDSREGFGRVRAIRAALEDVDHDGDLDLILHFDMEEIVASHTLDTDSVDAVLSADFDGDGLIDLLGHDTVRIVPPGKAKGDSQK